MDKLGAIGSELKMLSFLIRILNEMDQVGANEPAFSKCIMFSREAVMKEINLVQ